jgi:hypothetical protein
MPSVPYEHYDNLRRKLAGLQAEIDAAGMGDPLKRENAELRAEIERLDKIVQAARNLDQHRDQGYATLASYLIRLHEALDAHDGQPALSES